jgi:CDP-paratose 2-epimerase
VTGGAGFIGTNLTARLLGQGLRVRLLDSLARDGVARNLRWLETTYPGQFECLVGDVRNRHTLHGALEGIEHVYHLAAQVAVTSSLRDPQLDFAVNAQGTLNLLEAARARPGPPSIVFASTNKVYGSLHDVGVERNGSRYVPVDQQVRRFGIGESRALEFHSPYGCSKGAAEQYVLDYARTFGLRTTVLRMSCIYGPHQFGNEDQGWVAHFARRALGRAPLAIYGDGLQVRDILFVDDFVELMMRARERIGTMAGQAFNVGGGPESTISLLELLDLLEGVLGSRSRVRFEPWREADQKYYVSDTRRVREVTGWQPCTGVRSGVQALVRWLRDNEHADDAANESHPVRPASPGRTVVLASRSSAAASRDT